MTALHTLDELAERVAALLPPTGHGSGDGRIRAVPDQRTVRYYTTIGLVDRPAAYRGRTALYGERHLLQLLAIKRLQAEGRSLVEVQHALAGLPDADLGAIVGRQATQLPDGREEVRPASVPGAPAAQAARRVARAAVPERFWQKAPAGPLAPAMAAAARRASVAVQAPAPRDFEVDTETALAGVVIGDGLLLLFPPDRPLRPGDRDALAAAAAPLREALRARDLMKGNR